MGVFITKDTEAGAEYFELHPDRCIARTRTVAPMIWVDEDTDGEVVGIEFISAPPKAADWEMVFSRYPKIRPKFDRISLTL